MKIININDGHTMMVSNGEYLLIKKIRANPMLSKSSLEDYHQELADKLVSRGAISKIVHDDKTFYVPREDEYK